MTHASAIVECGGPDSPHAFTNVPLCPRNGTLDARCPICHGHGQWNTSIDLVSFRCQRTACDHCRGAGWVETGKDPIGLPDIVLTPEGYPKWIIRYVGADGADVTTGAGATLGTGAGAVSSRQPSGR